MPLDIGAAVREGAARTVERNGVALIAVVLSLKLASAVTSQTLTRGSVAALSRLRETSDAAGPDLSAMAGPTPFALPIPLAPALGIALALALVAEAVRIVAVRTFVSDRTGAIPREFLVRNIVWATLNGFVAGVIVAVLILVGTVLLVVPGVFVWLVFFFVRQEIAVEDKGFIDAMAGSWNLTEGHRIDLFGLGLIVVVVGLVALVPGVVLGVEAPAIATVATAVLSAVATVFAFAAAARAYVQLRAERAERLGIEPGEDPAFEP